MEKKTKKRRRKRDSESSWIVLKETHLKDKISLDKKSLPLTEPAWHPSRRLDYILTSPQINVKKYSILNFHFSDHLPLMIEFDVK